jgi:hypothetical protein
MAKEAWVCYFIFFWKRINAYGNTTVGCWTSIIVALVISQETDHCSWFITYSHNDGFFFCHHTTIQLSFQTCSPESRCNAQVDRMPRWSPHLNPMFPRTKGCKPETVTAPKINTIYINLTFGSLKSIKIVDDTCLFWICIPLLLTTMGRAGAKSQE